MIKIEENTQRSEEKKQAQQDYNRAYYLKRLEKDPNFRHRQRDYMKEYYQKNRERLIEYSRQYYRNHRGMIKELREELKEQRDRALIAQAALDTIAREETAASRMAELDDLVLCAKGEAAEKQYALIREMSDEEFYAYKKKLQEEAA